MVPLRNGLLRVKERERKKFIIGHHLEVIISESIGLWEGKPLCNGEIYCRRSSVVSQTLGLGPSDMQQ